MDFHSHEISRKPVFIRAHGLCPHPASGIRWKGKDTKLYTLPLEQVLIILMDAEQGRIIGFEAVFKSFSMPRAWRNSFIIRRPPSEESSPLSKFRINCLLHLSWISFKLCIGLLLCFMYGLHTNIIIANQRLFLYKKFHLLSENGNQFVIQ